MKLEEFFHDLEVTNAFTGLCDNETLYKVYVEMDDCTLHDYGKHSDYFYTFKDFKRALLEDIYEDQVNAILEGEVKPTDNRGCFEIEGAFVKTKLFVAIQWRR